MYCSRCGTWTPDSASACARCGEPLAPQVPVVAGVEVVAARPAPALDAAPAAGWPATPAAAVRYAGFWRRFAAMLVDGLLLYFPNAIVSVYLGLPTGFSLQLPLEDYSGKQLTAFAFSVAASWLYCGLLESSRWRGTLGQQLFGMCVGDLQLRRISFARATGRYFAQAVSALICCIGYLFNLWTPRRQTLHDIIAGCVLTIGAPETQPAGVIAPASPS